MLKQSKIFLGAAAFASLVSCSGGDAAASLAPNPQNSRECVAPTSVQIVDRLTRLPIGISPDQTEDWMQRQSDEGYVPFTATGRDRGTMTWTENRGGSTIEARVSFQESAAAYRSVTTRQEAGGEELICAWVVE